jgi:hypothetical protein
LKRPAALAIPAIEENFDLGGETVKLAGLKDIFALLRRHFRCIRGTRYAARAQVFSGDLVLGLPVFFACRWLYHSLRPKQAMA